MYDIMDTKEKISDKKISKTKNNNTIKKASKTWLAMLKNAGTGKINDREAVLK